MEIEIEITIDKNQASTVVNKKLGAFKDTRATHIQICGSFAQSAIH